MNDYLDKFGGEQGLGTNGHLATQISKELEEEMSGIARRILSPVEYEQTSAFVAGYCETNTLSSLTFERESVVIDWRRDVDPNPVPTVGNMSEAITDLSDRVSVFSQQIPAEVRWRIDLERAELEPFADEVKRFSAGAETVFQTFPILAENAKMVADNARLVTKAATDLAQTISPELARFDRQWDTTLATLKTEREAVMEVVRTERAEVVRSLDVQRESLTRDFARERAEITAAADRMAQNAISQAGQQVRELVRTVLIYLILLVLMVLGLPFLFGYWVGRAVNRRERPPARAQGD